MKNALFTFLFIFVLGNLCRIGLPWWGIAPLAMIAGWFFANSAAGAFGAGFSAGFALWSLSAWLTDSANGGLLSAKVGQLFLGVSGSQLIWATGVIGGIIAAFGALTGRWAREIFLRPQRRNYLQERRR